MVYRINAAIAALTCAALTQGCAIPDGKAGPGLTITRLAPATLPTVAAGEKNDAPDGIHSAAARTPAQQGLSAGIEAYNRGDFNLAIKRLGAPEIVTGDKALQLSALKYSAFSYCVTKRKQSCQQQFVKALRLEPGFELAPGERGHPLWGPAFALAKKTALRNRP